MVSVINLFNVVSDEGESEFFVLEYGSPSTLTVAVNYVYVVVCKREMDVIV